MVQGRHRVISYKIHKQIMTPEHEWFVVPNTHEPIIGQSVFDEAQRRLERDTRAAPGEKEIRLFSGLLRCASCGRSLHRKTSKNREYYFCRTYQTAPGACTKRSIRGDALEGAVLWALQAQIALIEDAGRLARSINAPQRESGRSADMLKRREAERAKAIKISDSLYADWKCGDITREEYMRLKADYAAKIDFLANAIQKIRSENDRLAADSAVNPYILGFIEGGNIGFLRRDLLAALVDAVCVNQGGELEIRFRFCDPYLGACLPAP